MTKILYLYNVDTTFVQIDYRILSSRYETHPVFIKRRTPALLLDMWKQTAHVDLVAAWFASWHSWPGFVAASIRKLPRLLFTAGYDLANEPDINYGLRRPGLPRMINGQVFRMASATISTSEFSSRQARENTPVDTNNLYTIPLGVQDHPDLQNSNPKMPVAFTVGTLDRASIQRKGIRLFVQAAAYLPDTRFIVVGKPRDNSINNLKEIATDNVEFTGFMSDEDLFKLRQDAKVYVQPSYHEGFGLAVAEAMLARCIPVVTRKGALPEVVGNAGIYVDDHNPEGVATAIQQALNTNTSSLGEAARMRILTNFTIAQREKQLHKLIESLLNSRS